jgi:hypothetical protein
LRLRSTAETPAPGVIERLRLSKREWGLNTSKRVGMQQQILINE